MELRHGIVMGACLAVFSGCSDFSGAGDRLPETISSLQQQRDAGVSPSLPLNVAAADWSCLNDPPAANPNVSGTEMVSYSVPVRSLFGAPLDNVTTRICLNADPMCSTPLSTQKGLTPEGVLVIRVPAGFNGFLEIEADGHLPYVGYMRRPVVRDLVDDDPLLTIPIAGVAQLAALYNLDVVPELGLLGLAVVDCRWSRVAGVTFSNNLGGRVYYFADGLPNVMASETDSQGYGGFFNVPVRPVEVGAQVAADGRMIGTRTVVPRPGWLMTVQVRPTSLPLD